MPGPAANQNLSTGTSSTLMKASNAPRSFAMMSYLKMAVLDPMCPEAASPCIPRRLLINESKAYGRKDPELLGEPDPLINCTVPISLARFMRWTSW